VAWLELTLTIPAERFAETEALLELAGANSLAITNQGEAAIFEPEPGTVPLWPTLTIRALFDPEIDTMSLRALLLPIGARNLRLEPIAAPPPRAEPIGRHEIGPRLAVVPAELLDGADARSVGLHMGLAFGTGQHETTRLCLAWLERELTPGVTVLDYGAGSGILALAAAKLGATSVTAVDNDPQALTAARRNARLNGMERAISVVAADAFSAAPFDLILANILARPLMRRAELFAACQAAGGRIVLAGILIGQLDELESCYRAHYDRFERDALGEWGLLTAIRRSKV